MIVPDASAVAMLFGDPQDHRVARSAHALRTDPAWVVPEHWRTEILSVVRGLLLGGKIDEARAGQAVAWLERVRVLTAATTPHLHRVWELRNNLTAYDAGYVAVAETHDVTLVTADRRIAQAGVARCPIQVLAKHGTPGP